MTANVHIRGTCAKDMTANDMRHTSKTKNIEKVMSNQQELVEVLGTFTPKIVRMDR